MNFLERAIEAVVGYPVDWNATGTWAGAAATATAVFLAARLSEIIARRAERRAERARLEALSAIYRGVWEVIDEVLSIAEKHGAMGPGFLRTADDLALILDKVPVLELPNKQAAEDLVVTRRILGHTRDWIELRLGMAVEGGNLDGLRSALDRVEEAVTRTIEFAEKL